MKIIEVTNKKIEKLSEMCEEMLTIGGKLMSCISQLDEEHSYNERSPYPKEGKYGRVPSHNEEDDYDMYYRRGRM